MTNLGTLPGGTYSYATGINDSGQIVGRALTAVSEMHAFLYSGGKWKDLGTLPGWTYNYATGINIAGKIVGLSSTPSGPNHAFLYSPGSFSVPSMLYLLLRN